MNSAVAMTRRMHARARAQVTKQHNLPLFLGQRAGQGPQLPLPLPASVGSVATAKMILQHSPGAMPVAWSAMKSVCSVTMLSMSIMV